jgi:hypothetical protein
MNDPEEPEKINNTEVKIFPVEDINTFFLYPLTI